MNEENKEYVNRKTYYSEKNRTASQYPITAIPIPKDLDKDPGQINVIRGDFSKEITEVNFSKKITQKKARDFLSNTILNIGLLKDKTEGIKKENTKEANFLFLDFEKPKKDFNKQVLSFDECKKILEDNALNYILKTSYNHTDENPRLHLFLPLLKPIKSDEEYKYNLKLIQDEYFNDYEFDNSTKNINRWVFSSSTETIKYSYCFEKNDINPQKADKHLIDVEEKIKKEGIIFKPSDKHIQHFSEQVENLYGFKYAKYDKSGIIKFYRDENDKIANVWYAPHYYDNEINEHTIYDKKEKNNVLFSYADFKNSINPQEERDAIQEKMAEEFENWDIDGGKKFVVTNEGLGKSSTILKMGKRNRFIFACHTKARVREISTSMTEEGIKHTVVLSNYEILEELASLDIAKNYEEKFSKDEKHGFKKFVEQNIQDEKLKKTVLDKHKENSQNLKNTHTVRIVTSKKLQVEIEQTYYRKDELWFKYDRIIFDEFVLDEWALYRNPEEGEETESKPTIWTKKDSFVSLAENPSSFQELLKPCQGVLILTTERRLLELIFYDKEYNEMKILEFDNGAIYLNESGSFDCFDLEYKLYDENVIYILTNSTRAEIRGSLANSIKSKFEKKYKEDFILIADNTESRDASHAGVKGSNKYADKNTIVIGTLKTEIEDNILYYSSNFFNDYKIHLEQEYQHMKEEDRDKKIKKEIQNYIIQIQLQTQVSQSIGRNSGFRDKGKKTVVILPLLKPNSTSKFESLDLNYVSPNVFIFKEPKEPDAIDDSSI